MNVVFYYFCIWCPLAWSDNYLYSWKCSAFGMCKVKNAAASSALLTWIFFPHFSGLLHLPFSICRWGRALYITMQPPFSLWMHQQMASDKCDLPSLQVQHPKRRYIGVIIPPPLVERRSLTEGIPEQPIRLSSFWAAI